MPKRKAPRKAGKRGGAGVRYAALKARWQARHRDPNLAGGGDWLVDKPELALDATPFLATLRALGEMTQDRRFTELRSWTMRSGLIDLSSGRWSRYGTTTAHPLTRDVCEAVENMIAGGVSKRLTIAQAVAEFAVRGNSFEAACKAFERVFDEWRKALDKNRPENV